MFFSQHVGINIFNLFPQSFCSCIRVQTFTGSVKNRVDSWNIFVDIALKLHSSSPSRWEGLISELVATSSALRYSGAFVAVHNTVCSPVPLLNLTAEWSVQGKERHRYYAHTMSPQEASLISTEDPVSPWTHQLMNSSSTSYVLLQLHRRISDKKKK